MQGVPKKWWQDFTGHLASLYAYYVDRLCNRISPPFFGTPCINVSIDNLFLSCIFTKMFIIQDGLFMFLVILISDHWLHCHWWWQSGQVPDTDLILSLCYTLPMLPKTKTKLFTSLSCLFYFEPSPPPVCALTQMSVLSSCHQKFERMLKGPFT